MSDPAQVSDAGHQPAVTRRRLLRGALVVVPLGALAYALLSTASGFDDVTTTLARLDPRFLLLALAGEAVHVLAMGQAYRSALAAVGVAMPYRRQLLGFIAGYGVGQLLPAGGAVGGAVVGQRMIAAGAPRAAAAAAVALTGPLSLMAIALVVSSGLLVTAVLGGGLTSMLGVAVAAVAVLGGIVLAVLAVIRVPARGHRLLDLLERPMRRVGADTAAWRASLDQLATSPPTARGLALVVAWATIAWIGNATVLWAVFAGLDALLDLDVLLLGFGVQHLVAMIPVSPGGVGLVEAGMAGTYTALGVASSAAVGGVIGYRIVSFWLPVALGLTAYLRGVLGDDGGGDGGDGGDGSVRIVVDGRHEQDAP